jgi:hypothetical protein
MDTRSRPLARAAIVAALAAGMLALGACAPDTGTPPSSAGPSPVESTSADASPSPSPSPSASASASVPTDCRAILSAPVLAQLGDTPLNPEGFGPVGAQADGSLICLWRDPGADTTYLATDIRRMDRGPALDALNALADGEGFTCYTPNGGTRCEKTWTNEQYGVTDGRTLFWRDGVLIDTRFSNLAPSGYTDSIVAAIFG